MKFIFDIFSNPPEMHVADIQKKKGYYSGLYEYYRLKIEFLTNKKGIDSRMLKLATQDAPLELRGEIDALGVDSYRKRCLEYYQKKMKKVKSELKDIDRIKIMR